MPSSRDTTAALVGLGAVVTALVFRAARRRAVAAAAAADYPVSLGNYTLAVDTASGVCQRWFNRGINWVAGFHREEAAHCFQRAVEADPHCAMAHWGLALANGPDYNFAESSGYYVLAAKESGYPSLQVACASTQRALALVRRKKGILIPASHRALCLALATRYEWPVTASTPGLQERYRDEMRAASECFPDDPIVQSCYAEAVMCLSPWHLYKKTTNPRQPRVPNDFGAETAVALQRGLKNNPTHLWLCHLQVHFNEMGPVEDFDWPAANALCDMQANPHEIGHLLHMATHLHIQVGDYLSAVSWNMAAYEADMKLWHAFPQRFFIYSGYLLHNLEFCCWAAMYGGNYSQASKAASLIDGRVTEAVLRASERTPMRLEMYRATALMVLVRFGKWEELIALPFHDDQALFLAHSLFLNYGKGIAHGARGEVDLATERWREFERIRSGLTTEVRIKHNVNIVEVAAVASAILKAEVQYRQGNFADAFSAARIAVARFDALPYDEPHGWLISPRQTLAALLTEQRKFQEAEIVYKEDLEMFPKNIWSLTGLLICHKGLGNTEALAALGSDLDVARDHADFAVGASCACAVEDWKASTAAHSPKKGALASVR